MPLPLAQRQGVDGRYKAGHDEMARPIRQPTRLLLGVALVRVHPYIDLTGHHSAIAVDGHGDCAANPW